MTLPAGERLARGSARRSTAARAGEMLRVIATHLMRFQEIRYVGSLQTDAFPKALKDWFMFAVIFEVNPRPEAWDDYLGHAATLRPELLAIDGFIANERYASVGRPGWLVSLSLWQNEKALIRWRTHALHHDIQGKGRAFVFADYHLRVGEVAMDSKVTQALPRTRLDTTEVSAAKAVTLTERALDAEPVAGSAGADGFDSITRPGHGLYIMSWPDLAAAEAGLSGVPGHHRIVRVIRDYGMTARVEAPQYFPPVPAHL